MGGSNPEFYSQIVIKQNCKWIRAPYQRCQCNVWCWSKEGILQSCWGVFQTTFANPQTRWENFTADDSVWMAYANIYPSFLVRQHGCLCNDTNVMLQSFSLHSQRNWFEWTRQRLEISNTVYIIGHENTIWWINVHVHRERCNRCARGLLPSIPSWPMQPRFSPSRRNGKINMMT